MSTHTDPDELRTGITLVGAGSVGSLLAAALCSNRVPFDWVVRSVQRRAELQDGLRLGLRSRDGQVELDSTLLMDAVRVLEAPPAELDFGQWLILAVKAQQVQPLLAELRPGAETQVLVVANGLHSGPTSIGVLYGGANLLDGSCHTGMANELYFGPLEQPLDAQGVVDSESYFTAVKLQHDLGAHFLKVKAELDGAVRMWRKLAFNCVVNPITALRDIPNGDLLAQLDSPAVQGAVRELSQVLARCAPVAARMDVTEQLEELVGLLANTAGNSSSMREDIRHGRETEIRQLNLAVADVGEAAGVPCPTLRELGERVLELEKLRGTAYPG